MMANEQGLDFDRIRRGLAEDYPRAADMPAAGFAAGPACSRTRCNSRRSTTTIPARPRGMAVNEACVVPGAPAGAAVRPGVDDRRILGMAFKGGSDDIRSSLSYKLKRILAFKADECCAPTRT